MSNIIFPDDIVSHEELREYVVNCISIDELQSLYNDIETEGGSVTIPNRAIEVFKRRPLSNNTHYMLTSEEVKQLKNDPRVKSIQNADLIRSSIKMSSSYTQTGTFSKVPPASSITSAYKNWGLLRCIEGEKRSDWGDDTGTYTKTATIDVFFSGKNVDVIIVDGISSTPNHPEFAKNINGTGGTRYVQYDWYQLNATVGNYPTPTSYYSYDDGYDPNSVRYKNHGTHVAGIVAGNTNGFAKDANIYQISPYGFGEIDSLMIWDYIRAFHANKSVNPLTGRKNPTICNCSYELFFTSAQLLNLGFGFPVFAQFRDVGIGEADDYGITGRPLSSDELTRIGVPNVPYYDGIDPDSSTYNITPELGTPYFKIPYYDDALESDILSALDDGIIIVGSVGNQGIFVDDSIGVDYNNRITFANIDDPNNILVTDSIFYHKGSAPSSVTGVISVGAISADSTEKISSYTNKGPRVDVFAPGDWIVSSVATTTGSNDLPNESNGSTVADSRNTSYYFGRDRGTSMSSAQVTGLLACALEEIQSLTQAQSLDYIITNATTYQIPQDIDDTYYGDSPVSNTAPSYFSSRAMNSNYLLGAPNKYARVKKLRPSTGELYPPENYLLRPSTGILYPRTNIRIVT